MNRLVILRHGIALPHGTPDLGDDDRPLIERGEKHIRQIARAFHRLGLKLDRIVTSPLPRAKRTAEIVAEVLGLEDKLSEDDILRPGRTAESIREWAESQLEDRLLIVGHDPALSELVGSLIGIPASDRNSPIALKKGGAAAFRTGPDGYSLDWLATPRLFRRLVK